MGEDQSALEILMREDDIRDMASTPATVRRLWDVCGVPDITARSIPRPMPTLWRSSSASSCAAWRGRIPNDWFAKHVAMIDRTDGDIDALSQRIAQGRTGPSSRTVRIGSSIRCIGRPRRVG